MASEGGEPLATTPHLGPMATTAQLTVIGEAIVKVFTDSMIREMQWIPGGDEMLRRIVRDNLGGAADKISSALWDTL